MRKTIRYKKIVGLLLKKKKNLQPFKTKLAPFSHENELNSLKKNQNLKRLFISLKNCNVVGSTTQLTEKVHYNSWFVIKGYSSQN